MGQGDAMEAVDMTEQKILRALRSSDKPYATTAMLQDATGLSDQGVRDRLEELEDRGAVCRGKVGRVWTYWLPDYQYQGSSSDRPL